MNELKPCPFCGGRAEVQYLEPHVHMSSFMPDHHGSYVLECAECDGVGMIDDTRQGVIDRWNTRVSDWVSVTEFESNAEDGSWCWICHKGDVKLSFYLGGKFRHSRWSLSCWLTECISAVMPINKPAPPADSEGR